MEYTQSLAIWIAMNSVTASIRERGIPAEANRSQPEEVFVPFNLPPVKPQATAEAQPPVAASSSDAMLIGV